MGLFSTKKKILFADHIPSIIGGCDMHSHILPGIDDGAADAEASLTLIRGMMDIGYTSFVATPHIYRDVHPNDHHSISLACAMLNAAIEREGLPVSIRYAAEHMLDDHFSMMLENDTPLLCLKDKMVLVECSYVTPPIDFNEKIFNLQLKGYQPVLAHPERYSYWHNTQRFYDDLYNKGVFFQVNLLSLAGYYGDATYQTAKRFIENGMVEFLGSDLHHTRHLNAIQQMTVSPKLLEAMEKISFNNKQLFIEN